MNYIVTLNGVRVKRVVKAFASEDIDEVPWGWVQRVDVNGLSLPPEHGRVGFVLVKEAASELHGPEHPVD